MKIIIAFCALIISIGNTYAADVNYCKATPCGDTHIACRHRLGEFSRNCEPADEVLELSANFKNKIVKSHNKRRNEIAGGSGELPPAAQMYEMLWDDELEFFAKLYAQMCEDNPTGCHKTYRMPFSGKNIGEYEFKSLISKPKDSKVIIKDIIRNWFENWSNITIFDINDYKVNFPFSTASIMMTDRNKYLGCSARTTAYEKDLSLQLICLYSTNNLIGEPIYVAGAKPGSDCKFRSNAYENLCRNL